MSNSVETTQNEILAYLRDNLVQDVVLQAYPDASTVLRNAQGKIVPYVAVNFGDLQPNYVYNMATATGDDYTLPVAIQVVGDTPENTLKVWNKVLTLMLGKSFTWTGQARKRPGGSMWPIVNTDNTTEAYTYAASFGLLIQFHASV